MNIISGGSFCLPAILLRDFGLRRGSMPFDWLFCDVKNLISILENDFLYFLDDSSIVSITKDLARTSALNLHYDNGRKDRPFFNHKDPTNKEDREYYIRCVERFRDIVKKPSVLFVFEEFGEINTLYKSLTTVLDTHTPMLKLFAVRHRITEDQSSIQTVSNNNGHMLINFSASAVVDGSKFAKDVDACLLMEHLTSAYRQRELLDTPIVEGHQ